MIQIENIHSLQLETTSYCNAKCPHCPRFTPDGDLSPYLQLSHWAFDAIKKNIEIEVLKSLQKVVIEGDKGDPAMHPRAMDIANLFVSHANRPFVRFVTNGSIGSKSWWSDIATLGPNLQVTFSIDGLEDTNDVYRVNVSWHKAIDNAKTFIGAGGRARWKCIVFKHNQHQIEKIQDLARDIGFDSVDFVQPDLFRFKPSWYSDKTVWHVYNKNRYMGELRPPDIDANTIISNSRIFKYNRYTVPENAPIFASHACPNLRVGHVYITYQHHVVPCCMMHNYLYEYDQNEGSKRLMDEIVTDIDCIDLSKRSLSEILRSQFATNLENHFFLETLCCPYVRNRVANKSEPICYNFSINNLSCF